VPVRRLGRWVPEHTHTDNGPRTSI